VPAKSRAHYRNGYRKLADMVKAAAYADPSTPCARCGLTLAEHPPTKSGKPPSWDAGHVVDGEIGGRLRPEVASCNRSAGARAGNRRRQGLNLQHDY
jgi:hypothetical protein